MQFYSNLLQVRTRESTRDHQGQTSFLRAFLFRRQRREVDTDLPQSSKTGAKKGPIYHSINETEASNPVSDFRASAISLY